MTYRNNNALKIYEHMPIKSKEDASIGHTWLVGWSLFQVGGI